MIDLPAGSLNKRVRIERPIADDSFDGAGSGEWQLVATVWANIQDALPSRGENMADGMNLTKRPARVRMRYRTDVTTAMRLVHRNRVMQIIAGPAELGRKVGIELMVEDYSVAGNGA